VSDPIAPEDAATALAGVHVALTTPFTSEGAVDLDAFAAHCEALLAAGIRGLVPNGSLGEYESLTPDERRANVEVAVRAARGRGIVIAGVSAADWRTAAGHARHALEVGADAVMLLPPTNHAPTTAELVDHFRAVAAEGLPVVAYNNPFSTRTDLTPELLERLAAIDGVAAVKEFSGDVRRVSAIVERTPQLAVLCGSDDLALESALMGAVGWIGGFTGALPAETVRVWELGRLGDVAAALPAYRAMLPLLRWDATPRFVEAIKHTIDLLGGRAGGPPRPPRRVLEEGDRALVARQLALARAGGGDPTGGGR
jgi:dihydrodipicolinate synthase/N-acetylneuraminate lyase